MCVELTQIGLGRGVVQGWGTYVHCKMLLVGYVASTLGSMCRQGLHFLEPHFLFGKPCGKEF